MLKHVSAISCNNDEFLGKIISEAYEKVGRNGIVLMEESDTEETTAEVVDGLQLECGLTSPHLVTDKDKNISTLDDPYVLIVSSPIPSFISLIETLLYSLLFTSFNNDSAKTIAVVVPSPASLTVFLAASLIKVAPIF